MQFFDKETIQFIAEGAQKHLSATPVTCPKFMALLGVESQYIEEFRLLVRKSLSDLIGVKMGPTGGYVLKSAVPEEKKEDPLLAKDLKDKITSYLTKGQKCTIPILQIELGVLDRTLVTEQIKKMPEFKLAQGRGVVWANNDENRG